MRLAPRLIAIAVISAPLASWKSGRETAEMERLRSMSHDALLAYLQEHHKGSVGTAYVAAVILFFVAFLNLPPPLTMSRTVLRLTPHKAASLVVPMSG